MTVFRRTTSQSGNVLFLILIAVALFAALSYAVTSSTRSGGGDASKEKIAVDSAAIIQYPVSVQTAVTRQMLTNNISAQNLLFDPPSMHAAMTAANQARQVFNPSAGGALYQPGWWFSSCDGVRQIGTSGTANANLDIIAFKVIPSLTQCNEINARLGIPPTSDAMQHYSTFQNLPQMTLAFPGICNGGAGQELSLANYVGKANGCFTDGDWGYLYYHVLVPR